MTVDIEKVVVEAEELHSDNAIHVSKLVLIHSHKELLTAVKHIKDLNRSDKNWNDLLMKIQGENDALKAELEQFMGFTHIMEMFGCLPEDRTAFDLVKLTDDRIQELTAELEQSQKRVAELEGQLGKYELTSDEAHRLQAKQERLEAEDKALSPKDGK